jgi:surface antigen/uncharacterized protein YukE
MPRIRVTPEELIRAAQQMADIGGHIRQVASELGSVLSGLDPRAYDGQLYGKVAGRVSSAQGAAQSPANKLGQHSADLNKRAQAFTDADLFAVTKVAGISGHLRNPPSTNNVFKGWADWLKFPKQRVREWLGLGNLTGGSGDSQILSISIVPSNTKMNNRPSMPNTSGIGNRVPSNGPAADDNPEYKKKYGSGLYYRFADDGVHKSDCTWFAAEAVKKASGERIDINSVEGAKKHGIYSGWGNGGQWANSARDYWEEHKDKEDNILDGPPNHNPRLGDVAVFPNMGLGHVAFVEDARFDEKTKKWIVTIVEEDYYKGIVRDKDGNPVEWHSPAQKITVDNDPNVLRWRRTITYDPDQSDERAVNPGTETDRNHVDFIHFKYSQGQSSAVGQKGLDLDPSPSAAPSAQLRR